MNQPDFNNPEDLLQRVHTEKLDSGIKEMISNSMSSAKANAVSRGVNRSAVFYWCLFAVFLIVMVNMAFDIVHIKGLYYILFTSALLFNFLFVWMTNHRDQIHDVRSVVNNWEVLPNIGKISFVKNIRATIAEKAIFGGMNDELFKWLRIGVYILSPLLLANAVWQDRGFAMRSFLILMLSLMLVAVLHMYISVDKEWHSLKILNDRELLESYLKTLTEGYSRMIIMTIIIFTIICILGSWVLFGDILSKAWEALF